MREFKEKRKEMDKKPFECKTALQNWFGDRGEAIDKSWIKDWFVTGDYLYIQWTFKAPSLFLPDYGVDCSWYNWKSLEWELEDEGDFEEKKTELMHKNKE